MSLPFLVSVTRFQSPADLRALGLDADHAAEPLEQVLTAYDRGVLACNARDFVGAHRSIGLLRAALELDTDASRAFDALFAWCEEAIDRGDYGGAARCLATLRGAWENAALLRTTERLPSVERFAIPRTYRDDLLA